MTEDLASKTCTPCRGGVPPLTREQAEIFHAQAPDWQLPEEAHHIERSFRFRNFREGLTFVQEIGELAEAEGHHPNVSFGWGHATVSLQTKKINGLHENDFIMATKIDRIFARTASDFLQLASFRCTSDEPRASGDAALRLALTSTV